MQLGICSLKYLSNQPTGYKSTGKACEDWDDEFCEPYIYEVFDDMDCQYFYEVFYQGEFEGEQNFELEFKVQCTKRIIDFS